MKVFLFDVMSTLVYDPFYRELPKAFGLSLSQLLDGKDRTAWVDFECGLIDEHAFIERFWGKKSDGLRMRECFIEHYNYLEGVPEFLSRLRQQGHTIVTASNYPVWYEHLDEKLDLSAFVDAHFVSYQMGVRKPQTQFFQHILNTLGVDVRSCCFVDDRKENCDAAASFGMSTHHVRGNYPLQKAMGYKFSE